MENTGASKVKEIMWLGLCFVFGVGFVKVTIRHASLGWVVLPTWLKNKERENQLLDQFNAYLTQMENLVA